MKKFLEAVKSGDLKTVKSYIEMMPQLANCQDEDGFTPLMWAIYGKHFEVVKFLVENNADVNAQNYDTGSYVVHFAAECGDIVMMQYLLKCGANPHAKNEEQNMTVLHYAIGAKQISMVEFLLQLLAETENKSASAVDNANDYFGDDLENEQVKHRAQPASMAQPKNVQERNILSTAIGLWDLNAVSIICQYKKLNANDYICSRKLSDIFNNEAIIKELEIDGLSYNAGGSDLEGVDIMCEFIRDYSNAAENCFDTGPLRSILKGFEALKERIIKHQSLPSLQKLLSYPEPIYFVTGFDEHFVPGVVQDNGSFKFSLADRGFFSKVNTSGKKVFPISKIETNDPTIAEQVFVELNNAASQNYAIGSDIIFKQVPELTKTNYTADESFEQSPYKGGRCYFENLKSLFLYVLIKSYGPKQGSLIYKDFVFYMHFSIAEQFAEKVTRSNAKIVLELCNVLLEKKYKKLMSLNNGEYHLVIDTLKGRDKIMSCSWLTPAHSSAVLKKSN